MIVAYMMENGNRFILMEQPLKSFLTMKEKEIKYGCPTSKMAAERIILFTRKTHSSPITTLPILRTCKSRKNLNLIKTDYLMVNGSNSMKTVKQR